MDALAKSPCVISDIMGYVMMTAQSDICSYIGSHSSRVHTNYSSEVLRLSSRYDG